MNIIIRLSLLHSYLYIRYFPIVTHQKYLNLRIVLVGILSIAFFFFFLVKIQESYWTTVINFVD